MISTVSVLVLAVTAGWTSSSHPGTSRIAKMAASTIVIVSVFLPDVDLTAYAWWILTALALSWIGDLALSFTPRAAFLGGLVAFAMAHVAYVAAFLTRSSLASGSLVIGGLAMGAVGAVTILWLLPYLDDRMRIPVIAYVVIITAMVAAAFGTHGTDPDPRIPIAAAVFAASDILVARNQFVTPSVWNRIIGLPLYFAAQLLFAATV